MQLPAFASTLGDITRANTPKATAGYGHGESATSFDSFGWASPCLLLDRRRYQGTLQLGRSRGLQDPRESDKTVRPPANILNKNHNFAKAGSASTELEGKKFASPVALLSIVNSFLSLSSLPRALVKTIARSR